MAPKPLGRGWIPLVNRAAAALRTEGFHGPESTGASATGETNGRDFETRFGAYLDEVLRWNEKTDLTAARSAEELVDLSLADAWVIAFGVPDDPRVRYVDVGSGAGAPGLVVALLRPDVRVTLVEPRSRRVAFLRTMIGKLGLSSVDVVRSRSDVLPPGSFDVSMARATLPPPDWLREGARLASSVWVLLARVNAPEIPHAVIDRDASYTWPLTGVPRRALRYTVTPETDPARSSG